MYFRILEYLYLISFKGFEAKAFVKVYSFDVIPVYFQFNRAAKGTGKLDGLQGQGTAKTPALVIRVDGEMMEIYPPAVPAQPAPWPDC